MNFFGGLANLRHKTLWWYLDGLYLETCTMPCSTIVSYAVPFVVSRKDCLPITLIFPPAQHACAL